MNRKLVHVTCMPIRWGDMDAMGHVNNTIYFRYIEQARIEWMQEVGGLSDGHEEGPVIINAHCTFLRQLKYPGEIQVSTFAGPAGRSSFETWVEIRRLDTPDILVAEGGAKVVWMNFRQEKSVPLPAFVRALLPATPET